MMEATMVGIADLLVNNHPVEPRIALFTAAALAD
jgi:hypothetical protein